MSEASDDLLYFNGIHATSGDYALSPVPGESLARALRGLDEPANIAELRYRHEQRDVLHFGVREGVDPKRLDQAGWGAIFPFGGDEAIREALQPLLSWRQQQTGPLFKLYVDGEGYRPGESKAKFLARHGAGPGPADPNKVPYYLLIVGGPEEIPFRFQSQLDVQYAVGRLHFDSVEQYAHYAAAVVSVERGEVEKQPSAIFFGVRNDDDKATNLSSRGLIEPVSAHLEAREGRWQVDSVLGHEATKAKLGQILDESSPALLFTASHGMEFELGDERQVGHQGAFLCQDWPGPKAWKGQGPITQDFYFAGDDISSRAQLAGMICFSFACYGAGTPQHDDFAKQAFKDHRREIAPYPFLGGLPKKMLAHAGGGALAFIGHVERAWGYSFLWKGAGPQTAVFESAIDRLLDGHPVGSAFEYFDERYAELSTMLSDELESIDFGVDVDPFELVGLWTANNDARGYVVLGDPAVRLPASALDAEDDRAERVIQDVPIPSLVEPAPAEQEASLGASLDAAVEFAAPVQASDEEVRFSAYHPSAVAVGEKRPLLVYAHVQAAMDAIRADSDQVLGTEKQDYRHAEGDGGASLAIGTEITFVPAGSGLSFDPPQASVEWGGEWRRADFDMVATGERAGHVCQGSVACYVGPLMIAQISLPVVVMAEGQAPEPGTETQTTDMYQSVFASYSHRDTPVVEALETAYQALGMDYLRDVMALKSGERWSEKLLDMIRDADIVQLFWSEESSRSPYVEQEWRFALSLEAAKGGAFIRPIYWQQPMASVPSPLSHLHFARVDLTTIGLTPETPVARKELELRPPAPSAPPAPQEVPRQWLDLTVSTYTGGDASVPCSGELRAQTEMSIDGDVTTHVDALDQELRKLHQDALSEALDARLEYLRLMLRR